MTVFLRICFLILSGTLLYTLPAYCQNAQLTGFEAQGGAGRMLPIYPNFPEASLSTSFHLASRFRSVSHWDSLYHHPTTGLALGFHNFGNDKVLGHGITLQYFMRFHKKLGERWEWSPAIYLGASWFDRPYNYLENRENVTVGNAFSFFLAADARIQYRLTPQWDVYTGLTFHHSSNSHTTLPNVGINIPQIYLGAGYNFEKSFSSAKTTKQFQGLRDDWQFGVRFGLGRYELGLSAVPTNGPSYPVYGFSALAKRKSGNLGFWSFSLEGSFNAGMEAYLELLEENPEKQDAMALTAYAGHEFLYGRVGLLTQVGLNIYNPGLHRWLETTTSLETMDRIKKYVPGRFGINCYLNQPYRSPRFNAFVGVHIKSKFFQADYLDLVVGFTF